MVSQSSQWNQMWEVSLSPPHLKLLPQSNNCNNFIDVLTWNSGFSRIIHMLVKGQIYHLTGNLDIGLLWNYNLSQLEATLEEIKPEFLQKLAIMCSAAAFSHISRSLTGSGFLYSCCKLLVKKTTHKSYWNKAVFLHITVTSAAWGCRAGWYL